MSLDDRLSRLRDEADRDIPVPADLGAQVKARLNTQAPRRARRWPRFIEIAAACLILGVLAAMPLFRPTKPVPGVIPPVGAPIVAADLVALHMATEMAGWAMTEHAVLHTTDGGATWQDVSPKTDTENIRPAFFLDGQTAWVQEWINTIHGQLYRTTDGGQTWEKFSVTELMAPQFYFIDRDHGWALTSRGVAAGSQAVQVLTTSDGGKTWAVVNDTRGDAENPPGSLPFGGLKNGVAFRDANTGWATGSQPTPGGPWFYVSRDGGRTWQAQALPVPSGYEESFLDISPPRFFADRSGMMLVRFDGGESVVNWYTAADGGLTWQPGMPMRATNVRAWDFTDARHGWVFGDAGLYMTRDGGRVWERIDAKIAATERAIVDFATPTTGWVLTDAGLFKSTDGGRTWAPVRARITAEVASDADL